MSRWRNKVKQWVTKPPIYAVAVWGVALILFAVIADAVLIPIVAGKFTSRRDVPSLIGLPIDQAERLLADRGLGVRWAKEGRYSSEIPVGAVLVQVPEPGRTVKKGRSIFLTVSKGVREVAVPDLRGQSRRQGEISIHRMGLHQGEDLPGAHASIPQGVIIRTVPESGKMVRVGDTIRLVISQGATADRSILPDYTSLSLRQATDSLERRGFVLGEVLRDSSENHSQLPNTVLSQYPLPGEYLSRGDTISFRVVQ